MKPITIRPDGLLWRLATTYGTLNAWQAKEVGTDTCTYLRSVLWGVAVCVLITVMVSLVILLFIGVPLIPVVVGLVTGTWLLEAEFWVVAGLWGVLGLFAVHQVLKHHRVIERLFGSVRYDEEPSQVALLYRSFKDKVCVPIKVKEPSSAE
jgi:hypothetical protein